MTKSTKTTKAQSTDGRTAAEHHAFLKAQAENKLNAIASYLADHGANGQVNWGHAGDLGHLNAQLQEVLDFLAPQK